MAVVKGKEKIRLSSGEEMTLSDALDRNLVFLRTTEGYGRNSTVTVRYFAREVTGELSWEVGKTLYESRGGIPLKFRK